MSIVFTCCRLNQYLHERDVTTVKTDHKPFIGPHFPKVYPLGAQNVEGNDPPSAKVQSTCKDPFEVFSWFLNVHSRHV